MHATLKQLALSAALFLSRPATAAPSAIDPITKLDYGTFRGNQDYASVNSFLGIPFAKAGRFENPRLVSAWNDSLQGIQDATKYGPACPQQEFIASPGSASNAQLGAILGALEQTLFLPISNQKEDCLNINVQVPQGINSTSGLPVMFWIHGGAFEFGSSASLGAEATALPGIFYQGARLVQRSLEMKQPIIFVSANHRLNAFGTLSSQEINDAGIPNLVLKDQRIAMKWMQKYIRAFGGDPNKITLFGESAGSWATASHLLLNDGNNEGLFRGAIMSSGGVLKLKDYHQGQKVFNSIAEKSGCGTSSDKVECLKKVDFNKIYNAVQQLPNLYSYESLAIPWLPRPDGTYLKDSPHRLLRSGKVANVPYIIGDLKDEGTMFSFIPQINMTTDLDLQKYFKQVYFPDLSMDQIKAMTDLYTQDPRAGSPFDTGYLNQLGPQYKRLAALLGDLEFHAGRRDLLQQTYNKQKAYTFLIEQSFYGIGQIPGAAPIAGFPVLGSFHASDVFLNTFGLVPPSISKNTLNIMSTYISFVNNLDPNMHGLAGLPRWPAWDPSGQSMFKYAESGCSIIKDNFREKQIKLFNDNADTYLN